MQQLVLAESFTNQVMEIVVEQDAILEYYKIQNDASHTNQVSTTHIRQIGKSYMHTVTVSLNGGIVRNNLNIVLEAEHCEAIYMVCIFKRANTFDNHTVVDNVNPIVKAMNCIKELLMISNRCIQWKNICSARCAKNKCLPVQ